MPPELDGAEVVASPRRGSPPRSGSTFANLVMVGALAARLGEPGGETVADAADELLGKKATKGARDAVAEGWRWAS